MSGGRVGYTARVIVNLNVRVRVKVRCFYRSSLSFLLALCSMSAVWICCDCNDVV